MYRQITRNIQVTVQPEYLPDQSQAEQGRHVWAYHILIENQGSETVQLLTRYWHITDALGRQQEVRGPGVVGEQPVLRPGEQFRYTSGTPLPTPSGIMVGSYGMTTLEGERFDIAIPAFSLDAPNVARRLN